MALVEENTRKRQRFETQQYCRNLSTCVESEENPGKRICSHSNCGNVEMFSEIMSHEVDCPQESIHEELVWDMIKKLEEEIVSRSSHDEPSVNNCGSSQICEKLDENGDEAESVSRDDSRKKECGHDTFHGDLEDLLWASEIDNLEYYEDYGFFECLEMDRDAEHQLLLQRLWGDNDSEGCDTRDLFDLCQGL